MPLKIGDCLHENRYTIQKILGIGGMGITYLAVTKTGKLVVIKTIRDKLIDNPNFEKLLNRFREEALQLALCRHPQIVKIENTFLQEDIFYLVLEYIKGSDLEKKLQLQKKPLAEVEALAYIYQIAEALEYVHERGILHRDVKPENIMFCSERERAILIDFGIARQYFQETILQESMSMTPMYAAPEQYSARTRLQPYTDVYALAATLYRLITNHYPLSAPARLWGETFLQARVLNPLISDQINKAIIEGMALDPKQRPQSISEWVSLLPQLSGESLEEPEPIELQQTRQGITQLDPAFQARVSPTAIRSFTFRVVCVNPQGGIVRDEGLEGKYFIQQLAASSRLTMVRIPPGLILIGSEKTEEGHSHDEYPCHGIQIQSPYFLSQYPITQAQWRIVAQWPKICWDLNPEPSYFGGRDHHPVESISWVEAVEFCRRLSAHTSMVYRLPSEVEWEYACRSGTTTPFHFGKTITTDLANYDGSYTYGQGQKGFPRRQTAAVGGFPANLFGLHDMHGNVWEWCQDDWHQNYIGSPTNGSAWVNRGEEDLPKVLRGGSWLNAPRSCRSAYRHRALPDDRDSTFGLRPVCTRVDPG